MAFGANELKQLILDVGSVIEQNKEMLTDLDRAIGDADHGTNMARGFQAVADKLEALSDADPGGVLKTVGMTLVSTVGGAAGPLYGTAFLRAGMALGDKESLTPKDLQQALTAALEGVKQRGKAEPGDKTMLDALEPAVNALTDALAAGGDVTTALDAAVQAAESGVEHTKTIVARKGRASYLGERSLGHQDPGATSTYLILKAMRDHLMRRRADG